MIEWAANIRRNFQTRFSRPAMLLAALLSLSSVLAAGSMLLKQVVIGQRTLALLALGSIALAACLYPLLAYFLFPQLKRLRPLARWSTVAAALLFGFYMLTFGPWPLSGLALLPARLDVSATGARNPAASGSAIELLGFTADGQYISYNGFRETGDWLRNGNSLKTVDSAPAGLRWDGRARETVLVFRSGPDAGIVRVGWDGVKVNYDLYSPTPGEIRVHDVHAPSVWAGAVAALLGLLIGFGVLLAAGLLLAAFRDDQDIQISSVPGTHPNQPPKDFLKSLRAVLWPYGFLFASGVLAFLLVTRSFGLWIASDSSNYLSAARHLTAGHGYIALDGDTYTWWPPLYPGLLALLDLLPFSGDLAMAHLLHAALFGANLALAAALARQMLPSKPAIALGLLLAFFSSALLFSTVNLLSEPLFNLFVLGFLICLIRYLQTGEARAGIFATVLAAMVPLTRYAGVTVVIAGCALLLLYRRPGEACWKETYPPAPSLKGRGERLRLRLFQTFAFGLGASLPTAVWVGRNYLMSGSFTGPRTPSTVPLAENLRRAWTTVSGWYLPDPASAGLTLALVLLATCLALRVWKDGTAALRPFTRPAFIVPAVFTLVYAAQLVISLSVVENAAIGDRLLSPVFLPLTFLLLFAFWQLAPRLPAGRVNLVAGVAVAGVLLIAPLGYWARTLSSTVNTYNAHFSIYSLGGSPLIQALHETPLDPLLPVYSNCPRCMYVFADIHPAVEFNDTPKYRSLPGDQGPFYIVWFDEVPPLGMTYGVNYPLPDVAGILGKPAQIQNVVQTGDGAVYLVTP